MTKVIQLFILAVTISFSFVTTGAEPARVSNEDLEQYLAETNFAECESSPGGTAIIPREQLERLIQPGGGTVTGRPADARASR